MVGVPFLVTEWLPGRPRGSAGPGACLLRSQRIRRPPIRKLRISAVMNAAIERNVR